MQRHIALLIAPTNQLLQRHCYNNASEGPKAYIKKIYSLSSAEESCIGKEKVGNRYEFVSKVSLATLPNSQVAVGVESFSDNPHDSKILSVSLDSIRKIFGKEFSRIIVDRGYRGHGKVGESEVSLPGSCTDKRAYACRQHKFRCRGRSGIEAVIGHLKSAHRLSRNYLKSRLGDRLNGLLAGIGFNFRLLPGELAFFCSYSLYCTVAKLLGLFARKLVLDKPS